MDKTLSLLSGVLKITNEELSKKLESDEGFKEIEGKIKELNVFSPEDLTARDERVKTDYIDELVEKVGSNDVPTQLYNAIKGNVIEQTDKDIARKLDIESFTDHNDLIGKIQEKKADVKINDKLKSDYDDAIAKIEELNSQIAEKENEFTAFTKGEKLKSARDKIINSYPYAAKTDEDIAKHKKLLGSLIDTDYKLDLIEDQIVIIDENGKPKKDPKTLKLLDPFETIKSEMAGFVSQDNGATGGNGDGKPNVSTGTAETTDEFYERLSAEGKDQAEISKIYQQHVKDGLIKD